MLCKNLGFIKCRIGYFTLMCVLETQARRRQAFHCGPAHRLRNQMKVYYIVPREGVHRTLTALGGNTSSGDLGANVVCEGLRLVSTVELGSGLGLALLEDSLGSAPRSPASA